MKEPNFFIIGTAKAGTSALHQYLSDHENIFMSEPKEPEYFADDFPHVKITKTFDEYKNLFDNVDINKHKIIGESSVLYIYSREALKNIKSQYPNAKLIAILRNPIDLMYSSYSQLRYGGGETAENFEEAWDLQESRKNGKNIPKLNRDPKILQYKEFAMLGKQLQRVYKYFPRDQVMVIFHEDFIKDRKNTYQNVLEFLNLEDDKRDNFDLINTNKNIKNMQLHVFLTYLVKKQENIKKIIPLVMHNFLKKMNILNYLRNKNIQFNTKRKFLDNEFKEKVVGEFKEDIELLESLTNRNLQHWKRIKK